jgi:hypothetical protein
MAKAQVTQSNSPSTNSGELRGSEQHRPAPRRDIEDAIAGPHGRKLDESATQPPEDRRADAVVVPRSPAEHAGAHALHRIELGLHPTRS